MKKFYTFLFLLAAFIVNSQNITFQITSANTGTTLITNNQVFNYVTTAHQMGNSQLFFIQNTSASTQTFTVRRYDDLLNHTAIDTASAHYCTDANCYLAGQTTATVQVAAGQTSTLDAQLDEASAVGESDIRYKISNSANTSDNLTFIMKYNANVGLKEQLSYITGISSVYPNPTTGKSYVDVNAVKEINNVGVTMINMLGSVVSSKQINLDKGKNRITIDSEGLESGIYFVSISTGSSKITKKITVTK